MKKQQLLLIGGAVLLFAILMYMGSTVAPKKPAAAANGEHNADNQHLEFKDLLAKAKEKIPQDQVLRLNMLENSVVRGDVKDQKIHVYHQLARFWSDSAKLFEPYAWYTGEAAKLENSEKSLTFAARLFLNEMLSAQEETERQHWLAENAKDLFDKALKINPKNDSNRIGRGACFIFGQLSDNPMEGILPIREIADKQPDNLYAQMMLALGGRKSGQYEKAIERLLLIIKKEPDNLEATFQLAECYELSGNKTEAARWYGELKKRIKKPEIKEELDKRISQLK